jgi:hypothetical protein
MESLFLLAAIRCSHSFVQRQELLLGEATDSHVQRGFNMVHKYEIVIPRALLLQPPPVEREDDL